MIKRCISCKKKRNDTRKRSGYWAC